MNGCDIHFYLELYFKSIIVHMNTIKCNGFKKNDETFRRTDDKIGIDHSNSNSNEIYKCQIF